VISLATEEQGQNNAAVAEKVAALIGSPLQALAPVVGGGNNRVYIAEMKDGRKFAVKKYPEQEEDRRDRLGAEYDALVFMAEEGFGESVPAVIAVDRQMGLAVYEWIEGEALSSANPESRSPADIASAIEFLEQLFEARNSASAKNLALASECCLSGASLCEQIDRRQERIAEIAETHASLKDFLVGSFDPLLKKLALRARALYEESGFSFEDEIPHGDRVLSPSDYGFHNARRRVDGRLVFLDFEYFGWDDPVKLTSDFLWHPGQTLSLAERQKFESAMKKLYQADSGFQQRLSALYPLYGLRWCLILLNEFLPERWFRRAYSGSKKDMKSAQVAQLGKAELLLQVVHQECARA